MAHRILRVGREVLQHLAATESVILPPLLQRQGLCSTSAVHAGFHYRWSSSEAPGQRHSSHRQPEHYDADTRRKILVNRLLYRSKQRGFLEMDLLVGLWAEQNVPVADERLLAAFEEVLDQENPDLFKWLTGQLQAPEELTTNPAFKALKDSVGAQLQETIQTSARTQPGKEWLRGWDDWKKPDASEEAHVATAT